MKINCAQSTPDLTITKADEVGSGYLRMNYPTSVSLSLIYEDPEASEKHCHRSQNTITPCTAPAARLGHFFDKPDILQEERFNLPGACYYLSPEDAATPHRPLEFRLAFLN